MSVKIIKDTITTEELRKIAKEAGYEEMIKAALDIERGIVAVGGEFHSDCSEALFNDGSDSQNVWGINIYFDKDRKYWVEHNSLINIKPKVNRSMEIGDADIKDKIEKIIDKLVA